MSNDTETFLAAERPGWFAGRFPLAGIDFSHELERVRSWASTGALALLDQGLISGSNFALGVALARLGGPTEYGAYMTMYAAFLLIANFYQALLLEPSSVLGFSMFPEQNDRYVRVLLRMHVVFCAALAAVGGAILLLVPRFHAGPLANALEGLLVATPCVLLFWLARCFAYLEFSPASALAGSSAYCAVMGLGLFFAHLAGGLTPFRAFLSSALGGCVASLMILWRYRRVRPASGRDLSIYEVWRRHWKYGRWGLGTVGISWAQTNSISFTSGYFLCLTGLGQLNALVALLLPMFQVMSTATRVSLPRVAQIYTMHGTDGIRRPVLRVAATLLFLTGGYSLVLAVAHGPLIRLIYGAKFAPYAYLAPIMSLHLVAWGCITACEIGFNAMQQPQATIRIKVGMVIVTMLASTLMSWRFGLVGAAMAVPACSLVTATLTALLLRTVWQRQRATAVRMAV
jgi:O-antigen/teichoic acid export membrane protein